MKYTSNITVGILSLTAPGGADCYKQFVKICTKYFGDCANFPTILWQINFMEINYFLKADDWEGIKSYLLDNIAKMKSMGADCVLIPCNSIHLVAEDLKKHSCLPFLSMIDVITQYVTQNNYKRVLLLGSKWTMEKGVYKDAFNSVGVDHIVPDADDIARLHDLIMNKFVLMHDIVNAKQEIIKIANKYVDLCDAIALACTDLSGVLLPDQYYAPVIDTTLLLGEYGVSFAVKLSHLDR
jgi:aspartate racemase